MRIKLAAQTFSSSVASAMRMLRGFEEFEDCGATIEFTENIDR